MICKACGTDLGEHPIGNFCPQCGEPIVSQSEQRQEPVKAPEVMGETPGKSKKKKLGKVCLSLLLGLFAVIGIIWWHDNTVYREMKAKENVKIISIRNEVGTAYSVYPECRVIGIHDKYQGGGSLGVQKENGEEIIPCNKYDEIVVLPEFERIRAYTRSDQEDMTGDSVILDMEGNVIQEFQNVRLKGGTNGFFWTDPYERPCSLVDLNGNYVLKDIDGMIDTDISVADGTVIIRYQKGGIYGTKWGAVDGNGNEIIPCKYDEIRNFYDGLAVVKNEGLIGAVDKTGAEVIPCKYTSYSGFMDYGIRICGDYRLIDIDLPGADISCSEKWKDMFILQKKNGDERIYGLVSGKMKWITEMEYDGYELAGGDSGFCVFWKTVTDSQKAYTIVSAEGVVLDQYTGTRVEFAGYNGEYAYILQDGDFNGNITLLGRDGKLVVQSPFSGYVYDEYVNKPGMFCINQGDGNYLFGNINYPNSLRREKSLEGVQRLGDGVILNRNGKYEVLEFRNGNWKSLLTSSAGTCITSDGSFGGVGSVHILWIRNQNSWSGSWTPNESFLPFAINEFTIQIGD